MVKDYRPKASEAEILQKNRIYDRAADTVWRLAVYDPVHSGWEFTNMGGRHILDFIGQHAKLHPNTETVEFCSGLGDTCRYLATKFSCHVTGVEMNSQQIKHARAKIVQIHPALATRIHFVHSNILTWQPTQRYDVVYAMDSLMLIDDTLSVLKKAHDALKPKGIIVLAEMMAGPHITNELRKFAWEVDGILSLPMPNEYTAMLAEAGFTNIESEDVTELAFDCFDKISVATQKWPEDIINAVGANVHRNWLQVADVYKQCFRERRFNYMQITAMRRGS